MKLVPTVGKFIIYHMQIKLMQIGCIQQKNRINKLKENQTELLRHGTTPLYQNVFSTQKKAIHLKERSPTGRKFMANQM